MQEEIEAQAQRLGLSSRIEWLGPLPRESLPRLWADTDALVAPSRSTAEWVEPTGSIVLEAMAHGVPAIVSRSGALPDVVAEAGLVIAEEDEPALTRALRALVDEPSRCRTLGELARTRVAEVYSNRAVAQQMASLWRQVLAPGV
jgi:glycosyltransferase involved in cell wall biosynthesis